MESSSADQTTGEVALDGKPGTDASSWVFIVPIAYFAPFLSDVRYCTMSVHMYKLGGYEPPWLLIDLFLH